MSLVSHASSPSMGGCLAGTRNGLPVLQPTDTRGRILAAAFEAFHLHGYQGSGLNAILARAGVTKGALYHHFSGKRALLLAVIEEIVRPWIHQLWVAPLEGADDPIAVLQAQLERLSGEVTEELVLQGCPLANLAQELSGLDEPLRARLEAIYAEWRAALAEAFRRGQAAGRVAPGLDPERLAMLVQAALEGCLALAKNAQSLPQLLTCGEALIETLERMKP